MVDDAAAGEGGGGGARGREVLLLLRVEVLLLQVVRLGITLSERNGIRVKLGTVVVVGTWLG